MSDNMSSRNNIPTFYEVCNDEGNPQCLVALVTDNYERKIFGYLANTGRWYRDFTYENEYYSIKPEMVFNELTLSEVYEKMDTAKPLIGKHIQWLVKEIIQEESKASKELYL